MGFFRPLIREHVHQQIGKQKPPRNAGIRNEDASTLVDFNESPDELTTESAIYTEAQQPRLINRLSEIYGTPAEHIYLTPGADEAIKYLTWALCDPEDAILIHGPSYPSYENFANLFQAAVLDVALDKTRDDFELKTAEIIDQIKNADDRLKLVYLCNPNNPTGSYFDENHIYDILVAARNKGIAAVVDEAYIEFSGKDSILKKEAEFPNLVVLRTLSKAYSLAGERVGVVICRDPLLLDAIDTVSPIFPIPVSALENASKVLDPMREQYFIDKRTRIAEQRDTLLESIQEARGMIGFRSSASCLIVGCDNSQALHQEFMNNGVSVKHVSGLGVRISIEDNAEQNRQFARIIHDTAARLG